MTADTSFSDLLTSCAKGWLARKSDEDVFSLAVPLKNIDPAICLQHLPDCGEFRFLWDKAPGFCLSASGRCQFFDMDGPRRFELAQRFSENIFGRLQNLTLGAPSHALPRVLFSFSFFEHFSERHRNTDSSLALQSLLPRWQLTRENGSTWLRLNGVATHQAEVRELAEKLWIMRESLAKITQKTQPSLNNVIPGVSAPKQWQDLYKNALIRGIDLVNSGALKKLVLAVQQSILLDGPMDPLAILLRIRQEQIGSCRFLWQRNQNEAFFGASPEQLLKLKRGILLVDALAGTASKEEDDHILLSSEKDRREHDLVVSSIVNQLVQLGLKPHFLRTPNIARYGRLLHLHTPITALSNQILPLDLANALHPTPAVAGLPLREAMRWLRTLEPFDRGSYAAPIGWIDNAGNAEFRVAIRCGHLQNKKLLLTAGAGLVKGSLVDREMNEVALKFDVLAEHLDLGSGIQFKDSTNRAIT